MSMFGEGEFESVGFVECPGEVGCSGAHVQFESEEQHQMVVVSRARAQQEREEMAARREHFRATGEWS